MQDEVSTADTLPTPANDTPASLGHLDTSWLDDDDDFDPPTPSKYPLHTNEGRCGFLESYIWFGEVALFEAVSHLWALMAEPKDLRCIGIGIYAGTGGSGKWALAKFLRRALRESLDYEAPKPWDQQHADIQRSTRPRWTISPQTSPTTKRAIQKYADLLVGEPGRHSIHSAQVIPGPWVALPPIHDCLGDQADELASPDGITGRPKVNFSSRDPSRMNDHIL